jgi:hypothetical protein
MFLFKHLFQLSAQRSVRLNVIRVNVYSKDLSKFLTTKYFLPIGKKKGRLHIPPIPPSCLYPYIRGLFDTDGSFYERGSGRAVVNICSLDAAFLQEVAEVLRALGFQVCISGKDLYIYRREHVKKFFEEIRPSNPKHIRKYRAYLHRLASSGMFKN